MSINPIFGGKEAVIGYLMKRMSSQPMGGDLSSLLTQAANAKLMRSIANTPVRTRAPSRPADRIVADHIELSASYKRTGASNISLAMNRSSTADQALENTSEIVTRLNELALMSSSSGYDNGDRVAFDAEAQELVQELTRMRDTTAYNGDLLLQGGTSSTFDGDSTIAISNGDITGLLSDLSAIDLTKQNSAGDALEDIQTAREKLDREVAVVGAGGRQLERAYDFAISQAVSYEETASTMRASQYGDIASIFGEELAPYIAQIFGF
jgi:flagellin